MNRKPKMLRYTKKDFDRQFPDDAACLEWLRRTACIPTAIDCKNCGEAHKALPPRQQPVLFLRALRQPRSSHGEHDLPQVAHSADYVVGVAMYLMSATRCGISAKQIERETGVTYKTAWRMFKQIRSMLNPDGSNPIGGFNRRVEMEEAYFWRQAVKGNAGRPMTGVQGMARLPVVGMVQRKGEVREPLSLADVEKPTRSWGWSKSTCCLGVACVSTDDFPSV